MPILDHILPGNKYSEKLVYAKFTLKKKQKFKKKKVMGGAHRKSFNLYKWGKISNTNQREIHEESVVY